MHSIGNETPHFKVELVLMYKFHCIDSNPTDTHLTNNGCRQSLKEMEFTNITHGPLMRRSNGLQRDTTIWSSLTVSGLSSSCNWVSFR